MIKNAIALIFRVPEKGKVKTRLAKEVGEEKAFYYYSLMLNETISLCKKIKCAELIGFYKGSKCLLPFDFPVIEQKGRNLGQIISNSIIYLKRQGYHKIIVIGSDSPNIPQSFFHNALQSLDKYDFVIGPTEDGGFYMFGCTKYYEGLFSGIKWGTNSVYETISNKINALGKSFKILPLWYDIDDIKSLDRWKNLKQPTIE